MEVLLIAVGAGPASREPDLRRALVSAGADVDSRRVPTTDRAPLDEVLDRRRQRRLVIAASPADLAGVLRRLMRRGELAGAETAVLVDRPIPFLVRQGIPSDLPAAARVAVHGVCRTVGVLQDDSGHLVVDHAVVQAWRGSSFWMRAYVDDERLSDGRVSALRVERGATGGLRATVSAHSRLGRRATRSLDGRALRLACDDAAMSSDGAARERPRQRRTWWDEPTQWRLAGGNSVGGRD